MGTCKHCGHPAGWLRKVHPECAEKYESTRQRVATDLATAIGRNENVASARARLLPVAREGWVRGDDFESSLVDGWEQAAVTMMDSGRMDEHGEAQLMGYASALGIVARLNDRDAYRRLAQTAVLRDLADGTVRSRVQYSGAMPNLGRNETLVWVFKDTEYLEDRVRREYVGRSQGFSFRIAKGVTYRIGGFRGRPVEHQERVSLGRGTLFVTSKNLIFVGAQKTFRIPYAKVVAFEPYSNGLGFTRDAANAKAQLFMTDDGAFLSEMVSLVSAQA